MLSVISYSIISLTLFAEGSDGGIQWVDYDKAHKELTTSGKPLFIYAGASW